MPPSFEEMFAKNLELYEHLIATIPSVNRKGKANPYTSYNGHMFSFLAKDGHVSLRFSKDDQQKFIEDFDTTLSEQYGAIMRGYAVVPDELLADTDKLAPYFRMSYEYICSLKLKPGKKKG